MSGIETWNDPHGEYEEATNRGTGGEFEADGEKVDNRNNKPQEEQKDIPKIDPITRRSNIMNIRQIELAHLDPPLTKEDFDKAYMGMDTGESAHAQSGRTESQKEGLA